MTKTIPTLTEQASQTFRGEIFPGIGASIFHKKFFTILDVLCGLQKHAFGHVQVVGISIRVLVAQSHILDDIPVVCRCVNSRIVVCRCVNPSIHYQHLALNIFHLAYSKEHTCLSLCTVYGTCLESLPAVVLLSCVVCVIYETTNHMISASTHNHHERNCGSKVRCA